jgi:hypothetical protein
MGTIAGVLALAGLISADPSAASTKLLGRSWEPTPTMLANATGATSDVVWLEDQMCFCEIARLPPVRDAYRMPFGLARRVHSDFRGRSVTVIEGL